MKLVALLALLSTAAYGLTNDAPADQYFGRLKMSALRIRYEIMQLRPRYETHKLLPEEAEHLAILDENAFYDWAAHYPRDAWLASTGYLLGLFYGELPRSDARSRAVRALTYIKTRFPNTPYARKAVAILHRGLPIRPDPPWAAAMRASRASPTPGAAPTPGISPAPSATASAASSPAPKASPASSPAPKASPASSPAPKASPV